VLKFIRKFRCLKVKTLGRPKRSWEDKVKTDLQEVGWGDLDCIDKVEGRSRWRKLVNVVMNFRMPINVENFLTSLGPVSFSGMTLIHGNS